MVSVIVPLLDEAANLPLLAAQLHELKNQGAELILVDGGSTDNTPDLARALGLSVFKSAPGRATQMNVGAAKSSAQTLVFLHADTTLPSGALDLIEQALGQPGACWGRFDVHILGKSALLPMVAMMMNLRSRLSGVATGDQAIFVRRSTFERLGGYAPIGLMEDIELTNRLRLVQAPVCIKQRVQTSGRRWDKYGAWRTIWLMWRLRWAYWRGADPNDLAKQYRKQ